MIANTGTSPGDWTIVRRDAAMGRTIWQGVESMYLWKDDEWFRKRDAAKSQVEKNLATLVGEAPEMWIGYSWSPEKYSQWAAARLDVLNHGEAPRLDLQNAMGT